MTLDETIKCAEEIADKYRPNCKSKNRYEVKAKIVTQGNCMMCGKELSEGEGIFFCKECEDKVRRI